MVAQLAIPSPRLDGPSTRCACSSFMSFQCQADARSSIIETTLNLRTTAFVFLNFQLSHLSLLPREQAHALLMSAFMLRDSLDQRQQRPVVVHVVSLHAGDVSFPTSMAPREGEPVLAKPGLSAFHHTGLERHLRERRVERVYLCGVSEGAEMVATALAARDLVGDKVWVVEDAWAEVDAEQGEAGLDLLAGLDMLVDVSEIGGLREEVGNDPVREKESAVRRELERRERKKEERERKETRVEGDRVARHNAIVRAASPREAEFGERPQSRGALLLRSKRSAQQLRV
ncbi:Isochorismatase hydrolase [Calocera cornea HHB12733]|uniref:Isochorismatase hydrolase n=1 Tax=Calocera cornea HHB12733 TaxID=1353952 RepID=A0A165F828_9BASI|nr:Isochorismatase hydrolase [Calocera cornea HHB12733]